MNRLDDRKKQWDKEANGILDWLQESIGRRLIYKRTVLLSKYEKFLGSLTEEEVDKLLEKHKD